MLCCRLPIQSCRIDVAAPRNLLSWYSKLLTNNPVWNLEGGEDVADPQTERVILRLVLTSRDSV